MATTTDKVKCFKCNKETNTYVCKGCSKDFCMVHLSEHRQELIKQLDEVENDHNLFRQTIIEHKEGSNKPLLIQQINKWEDDSITKIKQTAEECRQILIQHANNYIIEIENKLDDLTNQIKKNHQEHEFNEIDLNELKSKLTKLTEEFIKPPNISIQQDSTPFINKISVIVSSDILALMSSDKNKDSDDDDNNTNNERPVGDLTKVDGCNVCATTSQDSIGSAASVSGNMHLRSREGSRDNSRSSRRADCRNGIKCFVSSCKFNHPSGWDACEDGEHCEDFDCQANHPYIRKKPCRSAHNCRKRGCKFLHPVPQRDRCPAGDRCDTWNCKKWHPKSRPKDCIFGKQCYNTACRSLHPFDRQLCPDGVECSEFICQLDHPSSRTSQCDQGSACHNFFCSFLHPADWDPCEQGSECKNPICPHINHPFDRILRLEENAIDRKQQWHTCPSLKSIEQRNIEREQAQLPILAAKDEFCRRLEKERIIVVTAETGSGKSTQLPQYAAEYFGGLVICTQPRVIAAISLARRVANEYDGTSVGQSIGYRVGHTSVGKDKNRVPGTDILFMTDGTFIQESQIDSQLSKVRVLIIDEAHERSLNTDIIIGIAKRLLNTRPTDFYVVISSATIDPGRFLDFFQRTDAQPLNVLGRVHPVSVENIPKSNDSTEKHAISTTLELYNQHQGNTLVFLPGQREIENAMELFNRKKPDNCVALPLYGALSPEEQDRVLQFDEGANGELRMIVFCTNVAETSLTIKNTRLVIDSGLANEAYFDHKNRLTVIEAVKISRASADQRKGRAGRTAPGHCVRLYEEDDLVRPNIKPEILRASLDLVVLQLIRLQLNPQEFPFMDPPDEALIQTSLDLLKDLSCIDTNHAITQRGELFATLGIDPRYSAFLFDTYLEHGPVLELAATIVAILVAPGSVFSMNGETSDEKEAARNRVVTGAQKFDSDLFYLASKYKEWYSQGAIDSVTRTCLTCGKPYSKIYRCGPCRAAYSRTHFLNNKTFNYVESMSDGLMATITDSHWQLNPHSLPDTNESALIGANLFKYFPERYGRLIVPRLPKHDARMIAGGFSARISDISTFFRRQTNNLHFIAMSIAKLPSGIYVIDRLHPFCSLSHTREDEKVSES